MFEEAISDLEMNMLLNNTDFNVVMGQVGF